MTNLDVEWAKDWMRRASAILTEHRMELIDLDRAIGDGDHGENMSRGFAVVVTRLDEAPPEDVAGVFKVVAQTLMAKVGGASGPLYGTAFMRAAKSAEGELDSAWVVTLCEAALDGIVTRGKATTGEKTMVDAWTPAIEAARAAAEAGKSPAETLRAAADAAADGAEKTVPMKATKGRASYLGERSIGHKDPGSTSTSYLLATAADAAEAAA
ncbi:dihydroxyacetone kinase subunit DhaL [Micropruina sonneratiae]|uniref:dihydroxyacetone kinase subunit DhaL n=1 Tax=Micropruina sonneratiae TaxID=2986940 RepID=UPI0022280649|nr:dihydroxyacetone kinase subunit DhaL [Micropruina sp. KQZ13P-5]MCW3159539.1 dihydroxyacetone kinase subunit DhaL [Micropruina sp. KQZ13P-5]